ncbi:hypothetical protein [Geomicrobium sediminis]|uniref:FbpB family small basic protein n=1 Tax=Geomicrobium sediminis TaxID=1347788 RepID=A0ABS2P8E3_9BACL|nr:hypothetical protein [Geomicrobium sediminis]MBM7631574.1 hypothetical protein [Geomicrobium sediminis]
MSKLERSMFRRDLEFLRQLQQKITDKERQLEDGLRDQIAHLEQVLDDTRQRNYD